MGGESIGKGDDNSGGSGGGSDVVYKGSTEPMLVSPSDSYSNDEILVSNSRYSSCPAYTSTDYLIYPKENVCDFGLRRLFYSRQLF